MLAGDARMYTNPLMTCVHQMGICTLRRIGLETHKTRCMTMQCYTLLHGDRKSPILSRPLCLKIKADIINEVNMLAAKNVQGKKLLHIGSPFKIVDPCSWKQTSIILLSVHDRIWQSDSKPRQACPP